jgi:hypothetical protein
LLSIPNWRSLKFQEWLRSNQEKYDAFVDSPTQNKNIISVPLENRFAG